MPAASPRASGSVRSRYALRLLLAVCLSFLPLPVRAQAPTADANLATGISQIRQGDYFSALLTLNGVVDQLSGRADQSPTLARTRAYQALAYTLLDQPERARGFVVLALSANPNIAIDAAEFTPAVIALFSELRGPAAQKKDQEAVGDAADQAGGFQEALMAYLRAFQALPEPMAPADDRRLREKVLRVVQKLATKPAIPQEARDHLTKAQDLLDAEAILGGAAGTASQQAATEFWNAIRIAPWWPDATFRYATVLQRLKRVDEALLNLSMYRLADSEGYAAMVDRTGPKTITDRPATPALPEKAVGPAMIYVYWLPTARAMGIKPKTLCDDQHVADLQAGRFIRLTTAPGNHTLKVRDQTISGHFESGQDHYVMVSIEGFPAHLALHFKSAGEATAEMEKREIVANDATHTFSTECRPVSARPSPK